MFAVSYSGYASTGYSGSAKGSRRGSDAGSDKSGYSDYTASDKTEVSRRHRFAATLRPGPA